MRQEFITPPVRSRLNCVSSHSLNKRIKQPNKILEIVLQYSYYTWTQLKCEQFCPCLHNFLSEFHEDRDGTGEFVGGCSSYSKQGIPRPVVNSWRQNSEITGSPLRYLFFGWFFEFKISAFSALGESYKRGKIWREIRKNHIMTFIYFHLSYDRDKKRLTSHFELFVWLFLSGKRD